MVPGAKSKFGALMFEPEDFRKQIHCIEESTYNIFWTFQRPHSLCEVVCVCKAMLSE